MRGLLLETVKLQDGKLVENALVEVRDEAAQLVDLFDARVGGNPLPNPMATNAQAEIEAWIDPPGFYTLNVSDNADQAFLAGNPTRLVSFDPFVEVRPTAPVSASLGSLSVNRQIASYVLALADAGRVVEMDVAGANTLTVPPHVDVAFAIGTVIEVMQYGTGQTTIVAGAGVVLRSPDAALRIAAQYGAASLRKIAADEWAIEGNLL